IECSTPFYVSGVVTKRDNLLVSFSHRFPDNIILYAGLTGAGQLGRRRSLTDMRRDFRFTDIHGFTLIVRAVRDDIGFILNIKTATDKWRIHGNGVFRAIHDDF
ncbi:hypothetical protein, partial [Escherichia coli]|uniref:hypothetical protein n=1 Tax=Escherichia coli TaxID=562 RepID=UPI00234DC5D8